jgi:hypothetical protein
VGLRGRACSRRPTNRQRVRCLLFVAHQEFLLGVTARWIARSSCVLVPTVLRPVDLGFAAGQTVVDEVREPVPVDGVFHLSSVERVTETFECGSQVLIFSVRSVTTASCVSGSR